MRRLAAASVAVLLLVSCSNNDLAEQGERSRAGKDKKAAAGKDGKDNRGKRERKDGGKKAPAADKIDSVDPETGSEAVQAPRDFGGKAPSSGIDPSLARKSAHAEDSPSDARKEGVTPAYTEATAASIEGLGKNVRFTMTFGGDVPNSVSKDQYMVMAFGVTGREEGEGFAVGATCDENGWNPYAGTKGDNRKFPGRFRINGNQIVIELPWTYIRGPRAFEWYASTGWYGKIANQTHWSFDAVPNEKAGRFPG